MPRIVTQEEVIARFREVHGDRFDYSKVVYKGMHTKVCIICPIHGEFWQTPTGHLRGRGCHKCGGTYKLTTADFIRRALEVHGDRYDYSKVDYKDNETKVCIICPIHGEFWQNPTSHLKGFGCSKCAGLNKRTTEEFITEARRIHGDKYDYSKVEYKSSQNKVCIICPIHGEFWITPNNHLRGKGCAKCACEKTHAKFRKSTEQFIAEARAVWGDKFDYSKVKYRKNDIKVCIVCPKHGDFWVTPINHLKGRGCPKCAESMGERIISRWLDCRAINYIREYPVKLNNVLFGRNNLRVDFYLPEFNIIVEFNGKQHYELQPYWQTEDSFAEQQDRDLRLREHCKRNKIRLIEIPYTEIDNIDKILSKKIKV